MEDGSAGRIQSVSGGFFLLNCRCSASDCHVATIMVSADTETKRANKPKILEGSASSQSIRVYLISRTRMSIDTGRCGVRGDRAQDTRSSSWAVFLFFFRSHLFILKPASLFLWLLKIPSGEVRTTLYPR